MKIQTTLLILALTSLACGDPGEAMTNGGTGDTSAADGTDSGDATTDTTATGDGDATTGDGDGDGTTGDGTTGDGTTGDGTTGDGDGTLPDFEQVGPQAVSRVTGSATTANGCALDYEVFAPATTLTDATLFMAHGFMRSIADQAIMAEHVASFGMEVVTVSLCTNGFIGVDHQRNGEAIAQLAPTLASGARVYSGFSAGGLAAWVATSMDSGASAFLGLDPVDNGSIGGDAAAGVNVPILAAIAEPGQCNTNNNFTAVFSTIADARVVRVIDSAHFDYEQETCAGLECSFCAPAGGAIHSMARGMVASGAAFLTGAYPTADQWWYPGNAPFNAFQGAGRIESVQ